jgi:hypothetical protein
MNVGLEQDDGTRLWGTINSINTGTQTLTCSFTTTTTAAAGNTLVAYTTSSLINRPLRIIRATTMDLKNDDEESTMMAIGYDAYFNLPLKTSAGRPVNFYYDKLLNNGISYTGTLYLYPDPDAVWVLINFTYLDSIQDMINSTDNVDFPQEWIYPLVVNLAAELAYAYGKYVELQQLQPKAQQLKAILDNFDSDDESLIIMPDNQNYYPRP